MKTLLSFFVILVCLKFFSFNAWSLTCPTSPLKDFVDCLNHALRHVEVQESSRTLVIEGSNLQIVSSSGQVYSGNLIVGISHDFSSATNSFVAGLENTVAGTSNVIAGGKKNIIDSSCTKCSINGGELNRATGNYVSISGGQSNSTFGSQYDSLVGGEANFSYNSSSASTINGGKITDMHSSFSSVSGGCMNVSRGNYSSINGGVFNSTDEWSDFSTINGGSGNKIYASTFSTINAGENNNILAGEHNNVLGGHQNTIRRSDVNVPKYCSITAGENNIIDTKALSNTNYSTINGGKAIKVTSGSYVSSYSGVENEISCGEYCYSVQVAGYRSKINSSKSVIFGNNTTNIIYDNVWVCSPQAYTFSVQKGNLHPTQCFPQ